MFFMATCFKMHLFMHVDVYVFREAGHISFCLSAGTLFDAQTVCKLQLQGALPTLELFANDKHPYHWFESTESNMMP
jgi:hypothetical protein